MSFTVEILPLAIQGFKPLNSVHYHYHGNTCLVNSELYCLLSPLGSLQLEEYFSKKISKDGIDIDRRKNISWDVISGERLDVYPAYTV